MFKPVALFIGLRYTRARKKNQLISFVSVISTLGVSLGVLALIAVLSVINASTSMMRDETLKAIPHASIGLPTEEPLLTDPQLQALLAPVAAHPRVLAVAPYVEGEAWLRYAGAGDFIQLRGIDPLLEARVAQPDNFRFAQLSASLSDNPGSIILGSRLAARMGLRVGDQLTITALGSLINRQLGDARNFRVLGVADFGFYANDNTALINLGEARELFAADTIASQLRLRLRVDNVFDATAIAVDAARALPLNGYTVEGWSETQSSLFDALRLEKTMTGFMLLMIVIIGAVNIVSTLVMVVADKSADIAILRTMGASRRTIMAVFITQGLAAGVLGTLLGAVLGVVTALTMSRLTAWFEGLLNTALAPQNVYMISHLQAELHWPDVVLVCSAALLISFLATLYPAYRAARIQPAEVLRYE